MEDFFLDENVWKEEIEEFKSHNAKKQTRESVPCLICNDRMTRSLQSVCPWCKELYFPTWKDKAFFPQ